jgi:hypothetical protein
VPRNLITPSNKARAHSNVKQITFFRLAGAQEMIRKANARRKVRKTFWDRFKENHPATVKE